MNKVIALIGVLTVLAPMVGPAAGLTPVGWGHVQDAAAQTTPETSLVVSPTSGAPGAVVQVSGQGFDNSPCGVNLYWDSTTGQFLGFASTDDGEFSTQITIPGGAIPGQHKIVAQGLLFGVEFCGSPSGEEASTSFTVLEVPFDYNIYLQLRVLSDPGISQACLTAIQDAAAPTHAIVQLNSLPRKQTDIISGLPASAHSAPAVSTIQRNAPILDPADFSHAIFLPYVSKGVSASKIGGDDLAALQLIGITLLSYLNGVAGPGTAYLASVAPTIDAEDETFQELVRGLVCLEPEDKIQVGLIVEPSSTEPIQVLVQVFEDVAIEDAEALFEKLGLEAELYALTNLWETNATPAQIQALADEDIVQWIESGPVPDLPTVDDVRTASNVDAVQALNTATGVYAGLTGAGVQIGIRDTGVDQHHNDFAGRIIRIAHPSAGVSQTDHGTHVAGIAAGSGVQSNLTDTLGNPNLGTPFQWRGMAPQAQIAAYRWGNISNMLIDSVNNFGVDVSNHSYVLEIQGRYNGTVAAVDAIIRGIPAFPPFFPGVPARPAVYATANNASWGPRDCDGDGIPEGNFPQYPRGCPAAFQTGYFSTLSPCKNCISVANVTNGLIHAGSSSMGPTMDGRLKPEFSAIGSGVKSVGADLDSAGNATAGNGYRFKGGTSMSSPAVAGIVALLLEQYALTFGVNLDIAPPLPSTSKAILAQTATDLIGTDATINPDTGAQVTYGPGPDWATGYGIVDAQAAVQLIQDRGFIEDQVSTTDVTDQYVVSVIPDQTTVRVTLAWDDIAGTPNLNAAAAMLVNDLDLTVIEPDGTVHQPLVLPLLTPRDCDSNPANGVQVGTCAGTDAAGQNYFGPAAEGVDRRNNIEQVVVQDPAGLTSGNWTVQVSVLNADGVTVRLPLGGSQSYSLAGVTNQRADLMISKGDNPDPVAAGDPLVYTIEVTNEGPDSARDVTVLDTLPAGVTYMSDTAPGGCSQGPPGTLICGLGDLDASQSTSFDITVEVDPALVYNAGGPTTITNEVGVFSTTPDDDLTDNTDSEDTLVVAVADLEIVSFEAVDAPDEILVGEPVDITLRKEITNNGPSAPMDVELTKTAIAPADSIVTPTVSVSQELALRLDGRVVDEVFTIECGAASQHVFTFTNEIQPLNPEDTDPDESNNFATLNLDVECVVPVIINIKPGSDPNSINPDSQDVIPVAILTTVAGEYGTPLDFDATMVDPLSVRFGPRDEVWAEIGGAFEAHGRGHIEDSKDLDEITMDGDMDMVLHFHVRETGIAAGDTEACVKGEWIDEGGDVHTHSLFGCDAVRTVPE